MPSTHSSPADIKRIGAQILTLLGNYWTADESPEIRSMMIAAWLEDVEEFGPEIVAAACREWRRDQPHRPTIADIRKLCIELQADAQWRRDRALPKPERQLPAEIAKLWQGDGAGARDAAIREVEERYRKAEQWQRERALRLVDEKPKPLAAEAPKRPIPAWIVERDAKRAEAKRDALGLDEMAAAVDRYVADSVKRVPLVAGECSR